MLTPSLGLDQSIVSPLVPSRKRTVATGRLGSRLSKNKITVSFKLILKESTLQIPSTIGIFGHFCLAANGPIVFAEERTAQVHGDGEPALATANVNPG